MPETVRGKVKFEKQFVAEQQGREDEIETYSCLPRPHGSRRGANPRLEVPVILVPDFLQASEAERLRTAAAEQGETLTFDTLWPAVMTLLDLDKLTIDLGDLPQNLRGGKDCCDCVTSVVVTYKVYTVRALANERLTFGTETYPVGDAIAAWRASEPISYKFIRRCTPNPECCPDGPTGTGTVVEESQEFTKLSEIEWEITPGFQWEWQFDYKYKWGYQLKPYWEWPRFPEEDD